MGQARELGLANDIVRDQNIFDAPGGHRFGLAEFLTDNTDGAGGNLLAGDSGCLVGFGVHAEGDFELVTGALQIVDILFQHVEIDAKGGGVEFSEVHGLRSFR